MHGPYYAKVRIDGEAEFTLSEDDVREGELLSYRYYNSGIGRGLQAGFRKAVSLSVVQLLDAGQRAEVEVIGRTGTEGRDAAECAAGWESVRRDEHGRAYLSLGSKFNERYWKGI